MKVFIGQGSFKLLYNGGRLLLEEFGNAGYYLGREWNEYICLAKNVIGSRKLSTLARLYEHCRRNRSWSILGPEEQAKKKKKKNKQVFINRENQNENTSVVHGRWMGSREWNYLEYFPTQCILQYPTFLLKLHCPQPLHYLRKTLN